MRESDIEFLLMILAMVVMGGVAATLSVVLFMQGSLSPISTGRRAVKVPPHECKRYLQTLISAITLARAGQVEEGYAQLLSARRRILTLAQSDEPWVEEVARWYQQALNRYVSRHG